MSRALELPIVAGQEFAAPDIPAGAEAKPIKTHTDASRSQSILSHAAGHVSMMMLHRDQRRIELLREARRIIIRMQIVCDVSGIETKNFPVEFDVPFERKIGAMMI